MLLSFLTLSHPATLCLHMTLIQPFNILLPSLTHSYLPLLSSHALSFPPVCSSQSSNSFSPPAAPLWGAEVVFVRWVLLMSGLLNRCADRKSPVVVAGWLGKQAHQRSVHCRTHTDTHPQIHQSDAHSQISNISVQRSRSAEWSLTWLGGTHKAALQWRSDTHTHTPANTHTVRAESVSPQCDPRCAAGALCMNCYRPRSRWGIIWEPVPSPHTRSRTHTANFVPSVFLAERFWSPTTLSIFHSFDYFHSFSPPLLCLPLFRSLPSASICFSSPTSSLQAALWLSVSPTFPPSPLSISFFIPRSPSPFFHSALALLLFPSPPSSTVLHSCAEAD